MHSASLSLKDDILSYIRRVDYVSFAGLRNQFRERFGPGPGNDGMALELCENVILWAGMTEEAAKSVEALLDEKRIRLYPTSALVYMYDGGAFNLPILKASARKAPKTLHWFPVTLRPVH